MNRMCDACGTQPAATSYGGRRLCASCAQKRTAASALPFIGAALAAAGLIAGSALLAEKLQGEGRASPLDEIGKRLRGGTPTLDAYSRDLTDLAREGKLDPVIGRDEEIDRIVSILARRSKNNPVSRRRARRRKDRHRRRAGAANRQRRRAAVAARKTRARALARPARCRNEVPRRV